MRSYQLLPPAIWAALLFTGFCAATVCPSSDEESVLQPGHEYTYHFKSEAYGEAVGTTNDRSKLTIDCDVFISHSSECLHNLELQNCYLTATGGPPGSENPWIDNQSLSDLTRHPISFYLIKGEVTDMYTHEDDPIYFVNIKRGALSAFVFKLSYASTRVEEIHTDVHGSCPMTATPVDHLEGTVKTSKDMLYCAFPGRPDWQLSPWSLFWNMTFIQYVINSTTDCDYTINREERKIQNVFCKERHAIMLESSQRTAVAVQTNVHYTMNFVKSAPQVGKMVYSELTRRTGIAFEFERTPDPPSSPDNFLSLAKKMLSDLVQESADEVRLFTVPHFTHFVTWIRSSSDLIPLVDVAKTCSYLLDRECSSELKELGMSYLTDAIVQCNTPACYEAVAHLAKNGDFSPAYLNFVFYSWSNIHVTKPAILKTVMNLCKETESNLCWISLGSMLKRSYARKHDFEPEELDQLRDIANTLRELIAKSCVPRNSKSENYEDLLIYLKAVENMGQHFLSLVSDGEDQLIDCVFKDGVTDFVRSIALETLRNVNPCESGESCGDVYQRILPIVIDNTASTSLRVSAYEGIVRIEEDFAFEEQLSNLLADDVDLELKSYIAQSVKGLLEDPEVNIRRKRFVQSLKKLLDEKEISLEKLIHHPSSKSFSSTEKLFTEFPYLPQEMEEFGFRKVFTKVYELYDALPRHLHKELWLKAFSTLFPVYQAGIHSEGLEKIAIVLQKLFRDMSSGSSVSWESILARLPEVIKEFVQENPAVHGFNFDETVLSNIKKLEEIFDNYSPKLKPYFIANLDLFGSTLAHLSSGDLLKFASKMPLGHKLMEALHQGATYNATRVVRLIEAYHQVPTLMGLPLNWTTDATLAVSMRSGLKFEMSGEQDVHTKGFFQPSAALTFLNRMVLDFPTITQIGVQANSSAYTSTQWKIGADYSKEKKILSIHRPKKSQKLMELFRSNQLIKHDNYIDIPDWDIDRTSSSWCSQDPVSSVFGLQVCLDKSYPLVTERLKPWALMSGSCKWLLSLEPADENIDSYDVEILKLPSFKSNGLVLRFSVSGGSGNPEMFLSANSDETRGEMKIELTAPALPDFNLSLLKSRISDSSKLSSYRSISTLKLRKDYQYQLIFNEDNKFEDHEDIVGDLNRSSKSKKTRVFTKERLYSLNTPFNDYRLKDEVTKIGESVTKELYFSYEMLNEGRKWLHQILPPALWENSSKAWMRVQLKWKVPSQDENSVTRQTVCFIRVPQSTIEMSANALEMAGRQHIHVNLTKTEVATRKMMGFVNFTYDKWSSHSSDSNLKEIRVWNVTIPRKSWAAHWQKTMEGSKVTYELEVKRAVMSPKNSPRSDYVGWWNEDISDEFSLQEHQVKVVLDTDIQLITGDELVRRYSTLSQREVAGLYHKLIKADVALYYPFVSGQESVTFDGYIIFSSGPRTFRFQKVFDLESSYNNLRLTSHSVYRTEGDGTSLHHKSYFTHLPSQTKAFNTMDFRRFLNAEGCTEMSWGHDIRSHVFDLTSRATYKCHPESTDLHTLLLQWTTNSSYWNMLDMKLNQIVDDISDEYSVESVNITHPSALINVTADWLGKQRDHKKRIVFTCLSDECQNAEILLKSSNDGKFSGNLRLPDYEGKQISYKRSLSADAKHLQINIAYLDEKKDDFEDVELSGEILDPHLHIWKAKINSDTYSKIKSVVSNAHNAATQVFSRISKDPHHPLNKILEPALKVTLHEYWKGLKKQMEDMAGATWYSIQQTLHTLRAFYELPLNVLRNMASNAIGYTMKMYNTVKQKSVTIWAINYFHIPYYFHKGFTNLNDGVKALFQMFQPADRNIRFELVTGRILELTSFKEWPSISFDPIKSIFPQDEETLQNHLPSSPESKIGMIFGPLHVYTFDGRLFDSAEYSSDCLFLLAHDLRKSTFSVMSSQKSIHVLFPEMSVTVNDVNEAFVNGSTTPSRLPIQAHNGKVIVKRGVGIEIWSPSLRVFCRSEDFLCVLELDTWHSGGTFGLLGNADGSPHNEFMLPNGDITSNVLEFIRSYEVSGKSECKNLQLTSRSPPSQDSSQSCIMHYDKLCKQSPDIRDAFQRACESDSEEGHGPCYAVAAYSALCQFRNLPSVTDCNVKSQENKKVGHKLEVLFLVQEHASFTVAEKKKSPHKGIERLLTAVDEKFKSSGYSSIVYSLVAYGGKGVHNQPSVRVTERNIWVPLRTFSSNMLETLEFNGDERGNNLKAIKYGLDVLGYDTFDSKVVIVLAAEDKQNKYKDLTDSIQQQLEKNGITLYTISNYPSIEKGKKVFGVRADGLIFPSPKKDGTAFMDYPKGDLAKLSSATRGSVFLSKFLVANSPASYYGEIAEEIWAKVHKEANSCRECKTVRSGWWFAVNECSVVSC